MNEQYCRQFLVKEKYLLEVYKKTGHICKLNLLGFEGIEIELPMPVNYDYDQGNELNDSDFSTIRLTIASESC